MVFKSRNDASAATGQSVRRYHLVGVDRRCELLFHSMMRLVADKTGFRWIHDAETHDLIVSGPRADPSRRGDAIRRSFASFTVGGGDDCATLRLDGMADVLRSVERELPRAQAALAVTAKAKTTTPVAAPEAVKLIRWPDAALLAGNPRLLKLATLLLSRPMTVDDLARHSGVEAASCAAFVESLREAGLLQANRPVAPVAATRRPGGRRGLFAMIRERLGLGEALS